VKILFTYQYAFSKTGGIQTYNKNFIKSLRHIENSTENISVEFYSIYDNFGDIKNEKNIKTYNSNIFKYVIMTLFNMRKFDVIILGHINLWVVGFLIKLFYYNKRVIFCTHGIEIWKKLTKNQYKILEKSEILTVSSFSKNELIKYNNKLKNRITVIPNCILNYNKQFDFISSNKKRPFNLLTVTRLDSSEVDKGIHNVLLAISKIKDKLNNFKYTIIGKGDDRNRLEQIVNKYELNNIVEFLGYVEDLNSYYKECDAFILTSKKEGFGIVYLEAMQYKKPIIAANFGGSVDVIEDNVIGFLPNYDDIEKIGESILKLYYDPKMRLEMGDKGYEKLIKNFSFDIVTNRIKNYLVK